MRIVWRVVRILTIAFLIIAILSVTLFSVTTAIFLNRSEWDLFGYRAFTVETDLDGGGYLTTADIAVAELVESDALLPSDAVIFRSGQKESFGKILVRVTEEITDENEVLGRWVLTVPYGNEAYAFLRTDKGFALCVVLPVVLLFVMVCVHGILKHRARRAAFQAKIEGETEASACLAVQQEQLQQSQEAAQRLIQGCEQGKENEKPGV